MVDLVGELHASGVGLAICSDNNEFWFHKQAARLGLCDYFAPDAVILSCRIGVPKSNPSYKMFLAVESALGIDRENCIFIDDRWPNIQRSLDFGLPGIWFPSHSAYGATYLRGLFANMSFGMRP
jgi:HAD superfamily hydrolase (TIGR01509 family)